MDAGRPPEAAGGQLGTWHYIARVWREESRKPHRSGTSKISKDPAFAEKVADVAGLYLAPPGGAVVLSVDEALHLDRHRRRDPRQDPARPDQCEEIRQ